MLKLADMLKSEASILLCSYALLVSSLIIFYITISCLFQRCAELSTRVSWNVIYEPSVDIATVADLGPNLCKDLVCKEGKKFGTTSNAIEYVGSDYALRINKVMSIDLYGLYLGILIGISLWIGLFLLIRYAFYLCGGIA